MTKERSYNNSQSSLASWFTYSIKGLFLCVLFLCVLSFSHTLLAQIEPQPGDIRYLVDRDKTFTVDTILKSIGLSENQDTPKNWVYPNETVISFGFKSEPHWFVWQLSPEQVGKNERSNDGDYIFEFPFPTTDKIDIWIYDGADKLLLNEQVGDSKPFNERPIQSRKFLFETNWDASKTLTVVMRVENTDTMRFAAKLWPQEKFWPNEQTEERWHGIYFGVIIAMLLYNLTLAIGLRDKTFNYYLGWVACMSGCVITDLGFGFQLFWSNGVYWNAHCNYIFNCLAAGFGVLFFKEALSIKGTEEPFKHLAIVSLSSSAFIAAMACLFLPVSYAIQLCHIMACFVISSMLALSAQRAIKGDKEAMLLLFAFGVLLIGAMIRIANNYGLISSLSKPEIYLQIGAALEVLLLSLFLARRFNNDRRKRFEAQKELISTQKTMYAELERTVKERTQELESFNKILQETAVTDSLTGLKNRRYFDEKVIKLIGVTSRSNDDTNVGIMIIDIDYFKKVNDTYGHQAGDACLRHFAQVLQSVVQRDTDLLARYGGEEFVVALSNCNPKGTYKVAESIRSRLEEKPLVFKGETINLSCSIGFISAVPETKHDADFFLKEADVALYQAKETGRNKVVEAGNIDRLAS